jgi:ankyrin repeat protein
LACKAGESAIVKRILVVTGCEHVNDTLQVREDDEDDDDDDEQTFFETTALVESSRNGRTEVVELLIGAKADVNKCNQVFDLN